MRIPDPIPDELTVKQVADRWRVKYQNPADENYVLACYGRLQFCKVDLPSMRLVNYSRDEIITQVKKECSFMEHYDFVRDLPQYEKTMLRVRKSDLLAFEAGVGDKQPESATLQVEPAPALKTSNAEMVGRIQADIRAKLAYRADKIPARIYGDGCSEEQAKETTLTRYLKLETWTPIEAAMLVCGLMPPPDCHEIPKGTMGLENAFVMPDGDRFHYTKEVLNLWNHRESPPDKIRPAAFVVWCKTQGIDTGWLTNAPEWEAYVGESAQPEPSPAGKAAKDRINTGQVMKKFTISDEPFFQAWYAPETLAALQYPEDELNRLHSENLHRLALQDEVKAGRIILYDSHSKRLTKRAEIGFADLMSADDFIRFAAESNLVLEKRITGIIPPNTADPQPEIAQEGKGRRDKQIAAILKHGKSLCYNMKSVPYGGKAKIEKLCLEESQLFTKDGFKNAWQEARDRGLLDVEGVDKYRKPA